MNMAGHDHETQQKKTFMFHAIFKTINNNGEIFFFFEYTKPFGYGTGTEIN
jgi:hypothetical protein